jgi:hypothetical protein
MEQQKVVRHPTTDEFLPGQQAQPQEEPVFPEDAARTFYARVTTRRDIRELLKRLADR